MEAMTLSARPRIARGKGAARQTRMKARLPGVLYGPQRDAQPLDVAPHDLQKALAGEYGRNQLLALDIEGQSELAVIKEIDVHPVTRSLMHVDFYAVGKDTPIRVNVPLETKGRAVGVQKGGKLRLVYRDAPIRAVPAAIPAKIVIDVAALDLGETVQAKDLPLPDGVVVELPPTKNMVVIEAKEQPKPDEEETGPAEGAEPAPAAS